ncbi:hypothetical protein B0H14DRAFT_3529956 [Mycena olivaceomarginata]|nr:hypothetical protein B0H14DRAFT_3529956 [Mycena olivaceomarginata]
MQFNVAFIAAALLTSASPALSASFTFFAGADCGGAVVTTASGNGPECITLGSRSAKSIRYSGVPVSIDFFVSGGGHDSCTNGPFITVPGPSGCQTAPAGVNWESIGFH